VCEDGLFIPGFVVHHAHGEKMERVKDTNLALQTVYFDRRSQSGLIQAAQVVSCILQLGRGGGGARFESRDRTVPSGYPDREFSFYSSEESLHTLYKAMAISQFLFTSRFNSLFAVTLSFDVIQSVQSELHGQPSHKPQIK
jgi:hypothetical protein